MCLEGYCREPGLMLQAPGHCFSVVFNKALTCSDETRHHPQEPRFLLPAEAACWEGVRIIPGV